MIFCIVRSSLNQLIFYCISIRRYRSMTNIVDQLFPPVSELDIAIEYTNVNYWREPMLDMDESMLLGIQIVPSSNGPNTASP